MRGSMSAYVQRTCIMQLINQQQHHWLVEMILQISRKIFKKS